MKLYKIETGVKLHWFKTKEGAERFALRYPSWCVEEVSEGLELEWGKLWFRMPNDYYAMSGLELTNGKQLFPSYK